MRSLFLGLQEGLGRKIDSRERIVASIPEYAAYLLNRKKRGRTARWRIRDPDKRSPRFLGGGVWGKVFAGFISFNKEGDECFSFGKHKGKLVTEVLEKEPGYFGWLLNADFPLYTKKVLTAIKLRAFNNKLF